MLGRTETVYLVAECVTELNKIFNITTNHKISNINIPHWLQFSLQSNRIYNIFLFLSPKSLILNTSTLFHNSVSCKMQIPG
jgi:hypothetical protein